MKVCWNITSRCNKNCKYCFKFSKNDLSLEENIKILKKLYNLGVKRISWTGGEPFLYNGLIDLLKLSKNYGLINYVNTNASVLDYNLLRECINYIDKFIISLDFVNDELNCKYGIGENYYCHVKKILLLIKKINPNVEIQINTVVFNGNFNYIDELYNEICKFNIDYWKIIRFFPVRGKAFDRKDDLSITDEEFENVRLRLKEKKQKFKIIVHGLKEMEERHIIVLSSGKFVYSENSKDNMVGDKINSL